MDCLETAISYAARGKSVIPVSPTSKRPVIPWKEFQARIATEEEIQSWWEKYPDVNVGLVCGYLSDIFVVDCDSPEATKQIQDLLPDSTEVPLQRTPGGGTHFFFKHSPGYKNRARVRDHIDIRTSGGQVLISPSSDQRGAYEWVSGDIFEIDPPVIPDSIRDILSPALLKPGEIPAIYNNNSFSLSLYSNAKKEGLTGTGSQEGLGRVSLMVAGSRNDTVFRLVCRDRKIGMNGAQLLDQAKIYAKACVPPLSEHEAETIWRSALQYKSESEMPLIGDFEGGLTDIISQDGLERVSGEHQSGPKALLSLWLDEIKSAKFTLRDAYEAVGAVSPGDKGTVRSKLSKMCADRRIIRLKGKSVEYRAIKQEITFSDYKHVEKPTPVDLWFPLNIHHKARIYERNHIVLSGTTGQGKTTFILAMIRENQRHHQCFYYGSEMTAGEISDKISYMTDMPLDHWTMRFMKKEDWSYQDIPDVIGANPDGIHFVDYLSPDDEKFYNIGEKMMECTERLDHGVIVFSVQHNNPQSIFGIGGGFSAHGAVLYINVRFNLIHLAKVRASEQDPAPHLRTINFKYFRGIYTPDGQWYDGKSKQVKSSIYEKGASNDD